MRELTGYKLNQPFASVGVRRDCSSVNTLAPCGGSFFSITSEFAGKSDFGAHDVVVGIRTRLQVDTGISDKLAVWLSRDDVVNTFPIRGPVSVECTRRASLGDGEECVDEGKFVVTRKPQKRGSVAVAHLSVPAMIYAPITFQSSSSPIPTPVLALAYIKTNR